MAPIIALADPVNWLWPIHSDSALKLLNSSVVCVLADGKCSPNQRISVVNLTELLIVNRSWCSNSSHNNNYVGVLQAPIRQCQWIIISIDHCGKPVEGEIFDWSIESEVWISNRLPLFTVCQQPPAHVLAVLSPCTIHYCRMFSIASGIQIAFDVLYVDAFWLINAIRAKGNCIVKMTSSSRIDGCARSGWGMVPCEWFRKYIHRCFSCQNLIQSHEFIRRIRAGRIYHADCLGCSKCKRTLQNDDINALMKNNSFFNDLDYLCQSCSNSSANQSVLRTMPSSNVDEGGRQLVVLSTQCKRTVTFH